MPNEVNEHEAIKRFAEGLKLAAHSIRRLQFIDKYPTEPKRFAKGINEAIGSAYQLGHLQRNPDFFRIRDALEGIRHNAAMMGVANYLGNKPALMGGENPFERVSKRLKAVAEIGVRIARSKAVPNSTVLASTNVRQALLNIADKKTKKETLW